MWENFLNRHSFNLDDLEKSDAMDIKRTHLTQRQVQVLESKIQGNSISKIARELGTSRSNVSKLIRTAEDNILRAKNTLKLLETLRWPIKVKASKGANIYEVAERVFKSADRRRIKIARNYAGVVSIITERLGRKGLKRRKALRPFTVMCSTDGKVEVM